VGGEVSRGDGAPPGRGSVSDRPGVSIALVTRDGAATLPAVLDAIAAQETDFPFETLAVDSGSRDGSEELLETRVDRLVRLPRESFDHGLTRNLAVESSRGPLVVLLVQDAVPASPRWLAELVAPFAADARLAGSFSRQLPPPEASRLARWSLGRWLAAQELPHVSELSGESALAALPPPARLQACAFDNVCSCVRREVWERIPFRSAAIAEDVAWGREVLLDGYRIAYVPSSAVLHCHDRPARYELGRTYLVHKRLWELFGVRAVASLPALLRSVAVTMAAHVACLTRGEGPRPSPAQVARALALAVAWPLGQYLGGLAAVRGKDYLHPREV
jgi:rhamnosyltransferase